MEDRLTLETDKLKLHAENAQLQADKKALQTRLEDIQHNSIVRPLQREKELSDGWLKLLREYESVDDEANALSSERDRLVGLLRQNGIEPYRDQIQDG